MKRPLRARLDELVKQGFIVTNIQHGKHTKLDVTGPNGQRFLLVVSKSPSDWRVQRKFSAQLRRFVRQEATP
jgi:hypothetical protein